MDASRGTSQPHDRLFQGVFSETRQARALLFAFTPEPVRAFIVFESLEPACARSVGQDLDERIPDHVYLARTKNRRGSVLFPIEHRSSPPRHPLHKSLWTGALLLDSWSRGSIGRRDQPLVLPVLVAHGSRRWRGPTRLSEMSQVGASNRSLLAGWVLDVGMLLIDLAAITDSELRRRMEVAPPLAILALVLLKHGPRRDLITVLEAWVPVFRSLEAEPGGPAGLALLIEYVVRVNPVLGRRALSAWCDARLGRGVQGVVMTIYESLVQEGRVEGRVEGLREALLRILKKRFGTLPADADQRISQADVPALERWLDLAATASSLDEVLSR